MDNPVPKTGLQSITPAVAGAWLEHNTGNRPMRKAHVAELARDMAAGRWVFAGGVIGFDVNQRLVDGQHRLAAVVESNTTQRFIVVNNLRPEAQAVIDQGIKRNVADQVALSGEFQSVSAQALAAVARIGVQMDTGGLQSKARPTATEMLEWLSEHQDVAEYVRRSHNKHRMFGVRPAVLGYCMWRLSKVDLDAMERFFYDWEFSMTQGEGDPLAALIQRLRVVERERLKVSQADLIGAIFRVWNARRANQPLYRILFTNRDGQSVAIPEPK